VVSGKPDLCPPEKGLQDSGAPSHGAAPALTSHRKPPERTFILQLECTVCRAVSVSCGPLNGAALCVRELEAAIYCMRQSSVFKFAGIIRFMKLGVILARLRSG